MELSTSTSSSSDFLRVFISSRMEGLTDLRAILDRELKKLSVDSFVFESDRGARPEDPETASLMEVAKSDILVLILGDSYGEITEKEYDKARELGKPCLVYERTGGPKSDEKLKRFVEKLSGARGVPSRSHFHTAVDLSEQVAKDVQAWLVREYRRLYATKSALPESTRRKDEIDQSMKRLAASTGNELPTGNESDVLAWQLRQWFEALEYPLEKEPETGPNYSDLVVKVPVRRGYKRTLVRAISGEIKAPDIDLAIKTAEHLFADEVWLVALRRVSPAARKAVELNDKVFIYTLDELIEEEVDFAPYFEWLSSQVEAANIENMYVAQEVCINELDASGKLQSTSSHPDTATYVDQWMEDTDGEHLSLLGEFGTGKSWFSLRYANDMVKKYTLAKEKGLTRPRVPLVIRLREYARGFKDVGGLLTEFVFREHRLKIGSLAVLETLNRMGRLLFIFDGFDEMAARVDAQKIVDHFWSLAAVLTPGSKAILTCRTEYFQYAKQARDVLSGSLRSSSMRDAFETTRFQVATLQMFDETRLRKVLLLKKADAVLVEAIISNQTLLDLGSRPVMVDLLVEAMPNLDPKNADLAKVYYEAVRRKMQRDISSARTFTSMADKMFFMCEISWEMLNSKELKIHYNQIPDKIREYFGAKVASAEEDHWRHDLLSQTMLVRDDDGYYKPAHKSLIEFFSAYKLSAAIGALNPKYIGMLNESNKNKNASSIGEMTWSDYFKPHAIGSNDDWPITNFKNESDTELSKTWEILDLNAALCELIFLLSEDKKMVSFVKARSLPEHETSKISGKVLATFNSLKGLDLEGTIVYSCFLRTADFTEANLAHTTWIQCEFYRTNFQYASCRGASFVKSSFQHVNFRNADFTDADISRDSTMLSRIHFARWGTVINSGNVLIALQDGRSFIINASSLTITGTDFPDDRARDVFWDGSIGELEIFADFDGNGWVPRNNLSKTIMNQGVTLEVNESTAAGGDVEILKVKITNHSPGSIIHEYHAFDALEPPINGGANRLMAISPSGEYALTIATDQNDMLKPNVFISGVKKHLLKNFQGVSGRLYSAYDDRGAAFSPNSSLVVICEKPDTIGFWHVATGEFAGRVVFAPQAHGCKFDGATGLPDSLVNAYRDGRDGWTVEYPS